MLSYSWKRARLSLKCKRNKVEFELKKEQIESLKRLEDSGYLDLYFGDESHFGLTPNVPYAWQTKENPILLPAAKGKFLNVIGLMTAKINFTLKYLKLPTTLIKLSVIWIVLWHKR